MLIPMTTTNANYNYLVNATYLDPEHARDVARIRRAKRSPYQGEAAFAAAIRNDLESALWRALWRVKPEEAARLAREEERRTIEIGARAERAARAAAERLEDA